MSCGTGKREMHGQEAGDEGKDGGKAAVDEGDRDGLEGGCGRGRGLPHACGGCIDAETARHIARQRGKEGASGEGGDGEDGGEAAIRDGCDEVASAVEAARAWCVIAGDDVGEASISFAIAIACQFTEERSD